MSEDTKHEITGILREWRDGDSDAAERLFPLVYEELRRLAKSYLRRERSDHTLQPTALVHEAYIRMVGPDSLSIESRVHFYALASRIMRRILVDHARLYSSQKRGGSARRLSLDDMDQLPQDSAADIIELNAALERLEALDERKSRVVDMRFFGGLSESEIAQVLGVDDRTVRRDWQFAKLWLYRELSQDVTT